MALTVSARREHIPREQPLHHSSGRIEDMAVEKDQVERLAADIARLDVLGILHECEVACVSARDGVDVAAAHRQRSRPSSVCLSLKQGAEQNVTRTLCRPRCWACGACLEQA